MRVMIFLPPEENKSLKALEFMCCKIRKCSKKLEEVEHVTWLELHFMYIKKISFVAPVKCHLLSSVRMLLEVTSAGCCRGQAGREGFH